MMTPKAFTLTPRRPWARPEPLANPVDYRIFPGKARPVCPRLALPAIVVHKPTGQAVVTVDGRDVYLGKHGTPASRDAYDRVVGEWLANGRRAPTVADVSVNEVLVAYLRHAERHYGPTPHGSTPETANIRDAIRPVRRLYGATSAAAFGPLALRAVRDEMIASGIARTTVNARIVRVRRAFRWAASVEMIPASVPQALETLPGLQRGRTAAREAEPVGPVAIEAVEATIPFLPAPVAALVRLQLMTGCRLGEALVMRGIDLDRSGEVWRYTPSSHKNSWRGQARVIPIGPRAQAIIRPFLKDDHPGAFLFSPREAVAAKIERLRASRKSKPTPSEKRRCAQTAANPGRPVAERYDRRAYRQAIVRACDRAFPHPALSAIEAKDRTPDQAAELKAWKDAHRWSPLQLRHTSATAIRARFGLEAAQVVLGHAKPDTTLIYAERDQAKAAAIAAEMG